LLAEQVAVELLVETLVQVVVVQVDLFTTHLDQLLLLTTL